MIVPKLVSIIVVNWNGEKLLDDCLRSIEKQTYRHCEIIVVDNASSDRSLEMVKNCFPGVKLVELKENRGFAGGNNAGFKVASGEYVALVNTDVTLDPFWLEQMMSVLSVDSGAGICASRIMIAGTKCIDSIGEAVTTAGNAYKLGENELWENARIDATITGGSAAAILYRRSMLQDVGVFDEDFYLNVEDSDLHLRAWLAGWRCGFCSEAIANHHVSASIGKLSDQSVFYLSRNTEWFWIKNFPFPVMFRYLHHRIVYELLFGFYFCIVLKKWNPYLRGKLSSIYGVPRMLIKRQNVQSLVRRNQVEIKASLRDVNVFLYKRLRLKFSITCKNICL